MGLLSVSHLCSLTSRAWFSAFVCVCVGDCSVTHLLSWRGPGLRGHMVVFRLPCLCLPPSPGHSASDGVAWTPACCLVPRVREEKGLPPPGGNQIVWSFVFSTSCSHLVLWWCHRPPSCKASNHVALRKGASHGEAHPHGYGVVGPAVAGDRCLPCSGVPYRTCGCRGSDPEVWHTSPFVSSWDVWKFCVITRQRKVCFSSQSCVLFVCHKCPRQ